MSDLISRQAAINAFRSLFEDYISQFKIDTILKNLPSVELERKNGKWRHYEGQYSCEVCGAEVDDISPFCPWCGSDMRGENE